MTSPTLKTLTSQIEALQAQANALRKKEVGDIIAKAKDAIAHYGLTAEDLGFGKAPAKASKTGGSKAAGQVFKQARKPAGKSKASKPARAVKFADDQGHTWGGIGKRPAWFNAALAAGKKPEELLAQK